MARSWSRAGWRVSRMGFASGVSLEHDVCLRITRENVLRLMGV